MGAKKSESKNLFYIAGGVLIVFLYVSNSNKENNSLPDTPVNDLPIYLSESGYNGICAGLLSIEEKIDYNDVIFRRFYFPALPSVNVSHNKSYYECKFSDGIVTFRTSKNSGKTYSDWINKNDSGYTYQFKPSLSEKYVNMMIVGPNGEGKQITLNKIKSSNVAVDAKQIQSPELNKVCQHAIALEFGKKPNAVKIKEYYKAGYNSIKVGYVRPADNTTWNYECEINRFDNKVLWRVLPGSTITDVGRWRDGSNGFEHEDSKINYNVLKNTIEVTLKYYDGSGSTSKIKRV